MKHLLSLIFIMSLFSCKKEQTSVEPVKPEIIIMKVDAVSINGDTTHFPYVVIN